MKLLAAYLVYASYWIRPYDMLADRRRWFWQRRTRCRPIVIHEFKVPGGTIRSGRNLTEQDIAEFKRLWVEHGL